MLTPSLQKNDRRASLLIISFSIIVFLVVSALHPLNKVLGFNPASFSFDVHVFAAANAIINTMVTVLLLIAYILVRRGHYRAHRNTMYGAMVLSVLFLVSYITHHILSGDTLFGDVDHNHILSDAERMALGMTRYLYLALLYSHILLAAVILPFILYTAYRAMIGEYGRHKKLARWTFPLWLYVSITGPVVYLMISPYYS
jgi:putative membrane protein